MLQPNKDLESRSFELPPWPILYLAVLLPELDEMEMITKVTSKTAHPRSPHPLKRTRLPCIDVTEVNQVAISTPIGATIPELNSRVYVVSLGHKEGQATSKPSQDRAGITHSDIQRSVETWHVCIGAHTWTGLAHIALYTGMGLQVQYPNMFSQKRSQILINMCKHVCISM